MQKPTIIYEDDDIIVCHKPASLATQTKRIDAIADAISKVSS